MGASLTFGRHIILTESVRPIADGLNEQLNDPSSGNEVQGSQASYDYSAWIPENFDEILAAIQAKFDMGVKEPEVLDDSWCVFYSCSMFLTLTRRVG